MGEKVGYEEYTWEERTSGYRLSMEGRMTKPVPIEIEHLRIDLDGNFIPVRYEFRGTMSGIRQEIVSTISDGSVENSIRVSGHEQLSRTKIKRDALLLPNPMFAPYLVVGKRFGCGVEGKRELMAYIIPQIETPFILETSKQDPCRLVLHLGETRVELDINDQGRLRRLSIPSQNLEAVDDFEAFQY